ncbi:MAG: SDR family NAD(P)-dependent oxidoreductase, partial [Hyphomicrobiaceae bacterium]
MEPLLTNSSFDFSGQRVLITGAAGGLGSAMARAFAGHGAELLLADRDAEGLQVLKASVSAEAATMVYDQADLSALAAMASWAGDVDVMVNNAGILATGPLLEADPETIAMVVRTNMIGPMILVRHVGERMVRNGRGVIINISSQLAFHGSATRATYSAAKAGLAQFTRATAAEWAPHGVRVVAIAPGRTKTPMTDHLYDTPGA